MDREDYLSELELNFPEAFEQIEDSEKGLIHCEVAAFRRYLEGQMDEGKEWVCEKGFKFIANCLNSPTPDLENALEISFIEDLALGEQKSSYYDVIKSRAPVIIQEKLAISHEFWK